ncbi:Uncharacterized protein HZ326_24600 [Fusarium oxysporum f. sp. albedinis]|nr:Uncharacterized protein HZ326_24600 [Fusarium oxysporum f. sp. albedinis]
MATFPLYSPVGKLSFSLYWILTMTISMPDLRTCQGWLRQEVIEMIEKTVRDTEKIHLFQGSRGSSKSPVTTTFYHTPGTLSRHRSA